MNKNKSAHKAKEYISPSIQRIELDNEISLALSSNISPDGEPTWSYNAQQYTNDPFKPEIG
jgi:hypothetical protein